MPNVVLLDNYWHDSPAPVIGANKTTKNQKNAFQILGKI